MNATHLLDQFDVAQALGLSKRTVSRLVKAGEIPHVVLPGGEVRFDPDDLRRWIESRKRREVRRG